MYNQLPEDEHVEGIRKLKIKILILKRRSLLVHIE